MEIKIVCTCGTKFKFDVEPVHGRMPAPVACPACGLDATAEANRVIQANLPAAPAQPPVAPLLSAPAAAPGPPPAPAGLRINRPPPAPPAAPGPIGGGAMPPPYAPAPLSALPPSGRPKSPTVKVLTGAFTALLVGFVAFRFGYRLFRVGRAAMQIVTAVSNAKSDAGKDDPVKNLWYEDCAVLFIQQSNHVEVADACKEFWKTKLGKNLSLVKSSQEAVSAGQYELVPAQKGYVRLVGTQAWPVPQQEALAQHLSQKFGALVFEWRSEHFADTYHFGVYDQGTRKFHAQMDIKPKTDEEIVTTDGNDFAIAKGYKPGPDGFKTFNVTDADKITQQLGLSSPDESEQTAANSGMFLTEGAP